MNHTVHQAVKINLIELFGKEKFEKIKPNLIRECLSLEFKYYIDANSPFNSFDKGNKNQREKYWLRRYQKTQS